MYSGMALPGPVVSGAGPYSGRAGLKPLTGACGTALCRRALPRQAALCWSLRDRARSSCTRSRRLGSLSLCSRLRRWRWSWSQHWRRWGRSHRRLLLWTRARGLRRARIRRWGRRGPCSFGALGLQCLLDAESFPLLVGPLFLLPPPQGLRHRRGRGRTGTSGRTRRRGRPTPGGTGVSGAARTSDDGPVTAGAGPVDLSCSDGRGLGCGSRCACRS